MAKGVVVASATKMLTSGSHSQPPNGRAEAQAGWEAVPP